MFLLCQSLSNHGLSVFLSRRISVLFAGAKVTLLLLPLCVGDVFVKSVKNVEITAYKI